MQFAFDGIYVLGIEDFAEFLQDHFIFSSLLSLTKDIVGKEIVVPRRGML
jgi:hypothetical protein